MLLSNLPIIKRKRISLGCNFVLLVIGILAITMSVSAYVNYHFEHKALVQQLENKGELLGDFVADVSKDAILGFDFILLDHYMEDIANKSEIVYGIIIKTDKSVLSSHINNAKLYVPSLATDNPFHIVEKINLHEDIISQRFPIYVGDKLIGTLLIGLTQENINKLSWIALRNQLLQNGLIIFILSFSIAIAFRNKAVKPIHELIKSSDEITNGKLDQHVKVAHTDELARLAESFNSMTNSINTSNDEKDKTLMQLREANRKLENVTQAKSDFLANMSHEIRTPLTAILGYAETLKYEDTTPQTTEEAINSILKNGQHLQHIISDILDLTKIEANKLEIETFTISPIALLYEFETLISLYAKSKNLDFSITLTPPLPEKINTDPIRLKQILLNLCNNAIKFTQHGSIKMIVTYLADDQMLQIEVRDTGIGLTEEQQQRVFQPFTQADTSTTRQFGGTGLGLSLSQKLAHMLGGDINLKSTTNKGSSFTLTIKAGDVANEKLIESMEGLNKYKQLTPRNPASMPILKGKILLAEDTIDNQRLFSIQIKRTGAELHIANNGAEAIDAVKKEHFDLILMDMQMPVMDGLEAVRKIRLLGFTTPIIALTANAFTEFRDKCIKAGCNDYLSKPVDWQQFRQTISNYLGFEELTEAVNPLYSQLVSEDAEFEEIVDGFLQKIPKTKTDIEDCFSTGEWERCRVRLHELKGLGGAMGYPELSQIVKNIEILIKNEDYEQLQTCLTELYLTFERMLAGQKHISHAS